jgi:hypothetical protein
MHLPDDCGCKIDYVSQKRDLQQLDDRIRRRRENEDYSLRDLATSVNARVRRPAMKQAGMTVLDGQAEDFYHRLADEDEGPTRRREARRHLNDASVDVDDVMDDFVCYQTVRKHLNECLGVSTSEDYEPDLRTSRNRIGALIARVENVVHTIVERLRSHGELSIAESDVTVSVKIRCTKCDRVYSARSLFDGDGCECNSAVDQDGQAGRSEA